MEFEENGSLITIKNIFFVRLTSLYIYVELQTLLCEIFVYILVYTSIKGFSAHNRDK